VFYTKPGKITSQVPRPSHNTARQFWGFQRQRKFWQWGQ